VHGEDVSLRLVRDGKAAGRDGEHRSNQPKGYPPATDGGLNRFPTRLRIFAAAVLARTQM
jgi:hypothetical protein